MTTIFDPINIRNIKIENRIVLPPLVRFSMIEKDGFVTPKLLDWYESIAKNGVGLIIVEACAVEESGKLRENQLGIWDDKFIEGLSLISKTIHQYNTKVIVQIHHAGFKDNLSEISTKRLYEILEKFQVSFERAKKSGFDGIEIHGAHTYLLSQLASSLLNNRNDEFGGNFLKRMYFAKTLIENTKHLFDENFILGYRLGGNEPKLEDGIEISKYLETLGVDLLHVSSGIPDPKYKQEAKIDVPIDFPLDWVVYMATEIKRHVNIPVIAVRKIKKEKEASWLVEQNLVSMVAVGRAMIGRPNWIIEARSEFMKRNSAALVEAKKISVDIFCKIIDNFGDIGVVYRLTKELKNIYGNQLNIRIIINRLEEFIAINPNINNIDYQQVENFTCIKEKYFEKNLAYLSVGDVVIEAFGYKLSEAYEKLAYEKSKLIINLEYLTGEQWAKDFHLKESIIPSKVTKKIFYIPGFSSESGGLLISDKIKKKIIKNKTLYQEKYFGDINGYENRLKGTVFTYEKNFIPLLEALNNLDKESILLLMGDKTQDSIKKVLPEFKKGFGNKYKYGKIIMKFQEFLSQKEYEEVIQVTDFNFVRGEDSIIRGIISGLPFIWHIYCQNDYIHMEKLNGFLYEYTDFLNENGYKKLSSEISKIFIDFNYRKDNMLTLGGENYRYFFENLGLIKEANEKYSEFLCKKCNLTIKLKQSIDNYLGGKL